MTRPVDLREHCRLAWLVLSYGNDRTHQGNKGYKDDIERIYRYDSLVQNYTRVKAGDVVLVTGKGGLLGLARIARIVSRQGAKELTRCPECHTTGIRSRKRLKPQYRCREGHEFPTPVEELVSCTLFRAELEQFVPAAEALSLAELRHGRTDSATEVAMGPVDLELLRETLLDRVPGARRLLG